MRARIEMIWFLIFIIFLLSCSRRRVITQKIEKEKIKAQLEKLAPVNLTCDLSSLSPEKVQVIKLLIKASKHIDDIFLMQVYERNLDILRELEENKDGDEKVYLEYFNIMFGPWDRLNSNKPFINSDPKPPGANFYPQDMTKEEFENWIKNNPDERKQFENEFTMIRRKGKKLIAVPYSKYFKNKLHQVSDLLREAAGITTNSSLKNYLYSRAKSLLSNDYYKSDLDWLNLSGDIEIVIGPYEVYEDNLFGYKAAFESFVCVVDHEESEKLLKIGTYINQLENNLPIPDKYKNFNRGSLSPIKVVNEIFNAGDAKAGIQTTAFNLPNDERVREAKGSKKVLLKNVMKAKFEKCWIPIVNRVLSKEDLKRVSFDGYFNHTLMHEISHGLGPGNIIVNNRKTTVSKELKELYPVIEECKADVLSIYNALFLINNNVLPRKLEKTLFPTYLGGMFRSIRFGIEEAHGGAVAIQMNYLLDKGAFLIGKNGRFSVVDWKVKTAVRDLAREILLIQARGDYNGAKRFINKYCNIRAQVRSALNKLKGIPIDIRPIFPIEKEIM